MSQKKKKQRKKQKPSILRRLKERFKRKKKRFSKKQKGSRLLFLLKWGFIACFWAGVAMLMMIVWLSYDLPDIKNAIQFNKRPTVIVLAANGDEIARYGDTQAPPVPLEKISPNLTKAVIAIEDRRFYSHFGIDPVGLARAMLANVKAGGIVQGGSTITQQLAKNLFLTPKRTLKRKAKEALLAIYMEHRYSKEEILAAYLNRVYLGAGTYGVEAAANNYFTKGADQLNLSEGALIAGLLKAPSRYSPSNNPELAIERTRTVLRAMADAGYISAEEAENTEIEIPVEFSPDFKPLYGARYYADWLIEEIRAYIENAKEDLIVQTTLDPFYQHYLQTQISRTIDQLIDSHNVSQGAGIIMEHDGAVLAMVGGRDYDESQFNRAVQAKRQPGSLFKPIVYLTALLQGYKPSDRIIDAPVKIGDYTPTNFKNKYRGEMTLLEALALSINTAAVQVLHHVGIPAVKQTALQLGITDRLNHDLSLALGSSETDLLTLITAYGVIAAQGRAVQPYAVKEIRTIYGDLVFQREDRPAVTIISEQAATDLNMMLKAVPREGTATFSTVKNVESAGKTGTSQNFRDAWFIGYTGDLIAGIWYGNDDNSEMAKISGGTIPATTWRYVMRDVYAERPPVKLYGPNPPRLKKWDDDDIAIIPDEELVPHKGSYPIGTEENDFGRKFDDLIDNLSSMLERKLSAKKQVIREGNPLNSDLDTY